MRSRRRRRRRTVRRSRKRMGAEKENMRNGEMRIDKMRKLKHIIENMRHDKLRSFFFKKKIKTNRSIRMGTH